MQKPQRRTAQSRLKIGAPSTECRTAMGEAHDWERRHFVGSGERPCHTKPARSLPQTRRSLLRRSHTQSRSNIGASSPHRHPPFTHGHHTMAANDMPSGSPPVFRPQFFVFIFCASLPPSNSSPAFIQYVGAKFQACFRHSDQILIKILRTGSTASSGSPARDHTTAALPRVATSPP